MNNITFTKVLNYLIEGLMMFFLMVVFLFITGDKESDELEYKNIANLVFAVFVCQAIIAVILFRTRVPKSNIEHYLLIAFCYSIIVSFTIYAISDPYDNIEYNRLFILWLTMETAWIVIRYMYDSTQKNIENDNMKINTLQEQSSINQKYAVISLLAFIQGASPQSAFNDEANEIVQSTISSLGLTKEEAEQHIKSSMGHNPEQEIDKIMNALKKIQNSGYITDLYHKCMRIAEISGQTEMIEVVRNIFEEIRSK